LDAVTALLVNVGERAAELRAAIGLDSEDEAETPGAIISDRAR
jgi:hypothetical protein